MRNMYKGDEIRRIKDLLLRRVKDGLNPAEEAELEEWARSSPVRKALIQELGDETRLHEKLRQFAQTEEKDVWEHKKIRDAVLGQATGPAEAPGDDTGYRKSSGRFSWLRYAAAAVILLAGAAVFYALFLQQPRNSAGIPVNLVRDIEPGSDKAVLTLDDGTLIELDSTSSGRLAREGQTNILQEKSGQLVYRASQAVPADVPADRWNTIATPRGGGYRLTLPDGSRVWLNAASSIRFPVVFTGPERRVEVAGECYFEVTHDPDKVFKVDIADHMQVEVLGTSFNITAHPDESKLAATLLEGSLRVSKKQGSVTRGGETRRGEKPGGPALLSPGQQASLDKTGAGLDIKAVDTAEAVAWKNGLISFRNADMQAVMRQLSRWYDLQVTYQGAIPARSYSGRIKRKARLSEALEMLHLVSGAEFEVRDRTVTVKMPE